jgi:tetratricopeptide (TPR) repeat protein
MRLEDDVLRLAHTIRHLGDVHSETGRAELAEQCYDEALRMYRGHPESPPLDVANAVRSLAALKTSTGDIEAARQLWTEARDLYDAAGVDEGVRAASARLAAL